MRYGKRINGVPSVYVSGTWIPLKHYAMLVEGLVDWLVEALVK